MNSKTVIFLKTVGSNRLIEKAIYIYYFQAFILRPVCLVSCSGYERSES